MKRNIILMLLFFAAAAHAQTDSTSVKNNELFDLSLEELLNLDIVDRKFYLYGYINSNLQKTFAYPSRVGNGSTVKTSDPGEWSPVRNFHIYGKGNFTNKISYLFNIARNDDFLEIRNAWGNFAINDAF